MGEWVDGGDHYRPHRHRHCCRLPQRVVRVAVMSTVAERGFSSKRLLCRRRVVVVVTAPLEAGFRGACFFIDDV